MVKTFLANTLAKWFKRLGFAGALRWRILYWTYRLWPGLHIRDCEWDFVLDYLPPLMKGQFARVVDIGCTSSLFIYEITRRGYMTAGVDIRPYQEKLPPKIKFYQHDMRDLTVGYDVPGVEYLVCISVIEHIGNLHDRQTIENMANTLAPDGKLLITLPNKIFAQGHDFKGYSFWDFLDLIKDCFTIAEYTERKGQICACLVKK